MKVCLYGVKVSKNHAVVGYQSNSVSGLCLVEWFGLSGRGFAWITFKLRSQ